MARWIYGIHPVREIMAEGTTRIEVLLIKSGSQNSPLGDLQRQALSLGIKVRNSDQAELNRRSEGGQHQGVAARISDFEYTDFDPWLQKLTSLDPIPDILVLDGIQDPHNLGAIIRSADAFGVGGVIIPKDRAASVDRVVSKTSAGAVAYVPMIRVVNLARCLKQLKAAGFWVIGTAGEAALPLYETDLPAPSAIVLGNEGQGMRPLVAGCCDLIVSLPSLGSVNSLNVSVATGVILAEAYRQKHPRTGG